MRARRLAAFTLLEVLLALALIGMLVGALVIPALRMTDSKPKTGEEIFWLAVRETRKQALTTEREVRLTFSPAGAKDKPAEFVATAADGTATRFAYEGGGELHVDFMPVQKSRSAILVGGQLVETGAMQVVTFYGDGTCTPFRVQLRTGGAGRSLNIDPWTCAPMLSAADRAGGP